MKNRAIKFRVWWPNEDGVGGKMNYEPRSEFKFVNSIFEDMKDTWVFMQFTGLLDKHDKEIYEGDILKNNKHGGQLVEVYWKGCIKDGGSVNGEDWINWGGWHFRKVDKTSKKSTYAIYNSEIEIIGNIYENPDLLKNNNKEE